ncbi:translation initiation factor IF-3-like [Lineus longissimus]|uniref:translation initiation factor IF-3-like n=1 Tax=Lineus longissimus TaxID=88925 RepID=UPI00315D3625
MALLIPCRLSSRCLSSTAIALVRRNPYVPQSCGQFVEHQLRIGGLSATVSKNNSRGFNCCTPSFAKKLKSKHVKDSSQNEVDAILSAQKTARIESFAVQLLDEHGTELGTMKRKLAEQRAKDENLKLVCINPKAKPNIFQLMTGADLVKFDKKLKKLKKENAPKEGKTIRLSMGIGPRDLEMKLKNADEWIEKGHSVYVSLKAGRGLNQDDINANQAQVFGDLTARFQEKAVIKQALKTDTDLKVLIVPNRDAS